VMSITKKRMAHSGAPAILLTASGYTMNARPGPGRFNDKSHVNIVSKRAPLFCYSQIFILCRHSRKKIEI